LALLGLGFAAMVASNALFYAPLDSEAGIGSASMALMGVSLALIGRYLVLDQVRVDRVLRRSRPDMPDYSTRLIKLLGWVFSIVGLVLAVVGGVAYALGLVRVGG
jgi:hypothetical protein